MFSELQPGGLHSEDRRRHGAAQLVSALAHIAVLGFLIWEHRPIFVSPSMMKAGEWGTAVTAVYLPQNGLGGEKASDSKDKPRVTLPHKKKVAAKQEVAKVEAPAENPVDDPGGAQRAGSPYSSLASGPVTGHDVRPALPDVFHDPVIRRGDVPPGVEGNVMIEITIDVAGNITDMQVRQKLGYGIEEKVLAALQRWHFRPATMDGVAIASKQYVYFHIPTNG